MIPGIAQDLVLSFLVLYCLSFLDLDLQNAWPFFKSIGSAFLRRVGCGEKHTAAGQFDF